MSLWNLQCQELYGIIYFLYDRGANTLNRLQELALPEYVKNNLDLSHVNNHARFSQNSFSDVWESLCKNPVCVCACVCLTVCVCMRVCVAT